MRDSIYENCEKHIAVCQNREGIEETDIKPNRNKETHSILLSGTPGRGLPRTGQTGIRITLLGLEREQYALIENIPNSGRQNPSTRVQP